jgi:predicted nucleic-acid-binding Zn-ribbon protein
MAEWEQGKSYDVVHTSCPKCGSQVSLLLPVWKVWKNGEGQEKIINIHYESKECSICGSIVVTYGYMKIWRE